MIDGVIKHMKAPKGPISACPICNQEVPNPLERGSLINCPECGEYAMPTKADCNFEFAELTDLQRTKISQRVSRLTAEDPGIIITEAEFRVMLKKAV